MNPEDRMKLLRDPEQWNVRLTARTGVFAARRISPLFLSIATVATVAIVGVILFAVFGASIRAIRDPNLQPASPSPTPSAVVQPEQVFGGDCAKVFTDDQLASFGDFAGPEVRDPIGYVNNDGFTFTIEQIGGIDCTWTGDDGVLSVALIPAGAVPAIDDATCGPGYGEGTAGDNFCGIEQETNGIRITGGITASDAAAAKATAAKIISAFDDAAATATPPVHVDIPGAWANPVDCPGLDASIDASAVFGPGVKLNTTVGGDTGIYRALRSLVNPLLGLTCYWVGADGTTSAAVTVHGGGRWNEKPLSELDSVTPVQLQGVDAAYTEESPGQGFPKMLHVFDGPNWLMMSTNPNDPASMGSAAVTLVDALNAAEAPDAAASGTERPAQVFGGDCASVFSNAELSGLVGTAMAPQDFGNLELSPYGGLITDTAAVTAGGLICAWSAEGNPGVPPLAAFGFFYESTIDAVPETDCGAPYSEGMDGESCTIEHVTGGIRMSGSLGLGSDGGADAKSVANELIDLFEKRVESEQSVAPTAPAGSWRNPIDCKGLDEAIDASDLYGETLVWNDFPGGSGNGPIKSLWSLLQRGHSLSCFWDVGDDGFFGATVGLLGGGAWIEPTIVDAGATEVTIDGLDHAYVLASSDSGDSTFTLYVIDGPNILSLNQEGNGDFTARYPFVVGIIAALNGEAAPSTPKPPASTDPHITSKAFGDLVIGKPVPSGTDLVDWDETACGIGAWVPKGETGQNFANSFWVETTDGKKNSPILRITILDKKFTDTAGIHIFSTRAELENAYSKFNATYAEESPDFDLYVRENSTAQTVYEVTKPGQAAGVENAIDDTVNYIKIEDRTLKAHATAMESCGS